MHAHERDQCQSKERGTVGKKTIIAQLKERRFMRVETPPSTRTIDQPTLQGIHGR